MRHIESNRLCLKKLAQALDTVEASVAALQIKGQSSSGSLSEESHCAYSSCSRREESPECH